MNIDSKLYDHFAAKAAGTLVKTLSLGLGYTAVTTSAGGIGISYTYFDEKKSCSFHKNDLDFEGLPALGLVELIRSTDPIQRSMALAAINALNHEYALTLPPERNNEELFDLLSICEGTRVAMVGFFGPLLRLLEERKAVVRIVDKSRGIGKEGDFYRDLAGWAEVLLITSTSILNSTLEEILAAAAADVRTILLGPSTPLVPALFGGLPVRYLAGTVLFMEDEVLKAVRHGHGTPVIQKFGRKVICACDPLHDR